MTAKPLPSSPVIPALALALVSLLMMPMGVQGSVLPLDPPITLPGESQGHGPAQVALRDDGGFVALWVDVTRNRSIGRWLGASSEDKGGEFELMPEGSVFDLCEMERAADGGDRYLAAWRQAFVGTAPRGLVARPFDGEGRPLGPPVTVMDTPVGSCALAARPGGGWVLAWWGPTSDSLSLQFRFLDPLGQPEGQRIFVDDVMNRTTSSIGLAVAPSGRVLVAWGVETSLDEITLFGSGFGADGAALSRDAVLVVSTSEEAIVFHDLVAVPGPVDRFLLGWVESGEGVQVRSFNLLGNPQGAARRLDPAADTWSASSLLAMAFGTDGDGVVAWIEDDESPALGRSVDDRIGARLVDSSGVPRSGPFQVLSGSEATVALGDEADSGGIASVAVDRDASDRLAFGWGLRRNSPIIPTPVDSNWTNGARRFRETLDGSGPPVPPRPALTSPELPGFRVWADITPQGQATVPGTRVTECLPEVLCVAGALPDRAEVFVRVIGPRPNGFLWPVLVQLTPSGVELWIEQIATGEINYYRLEAAEPGVDELDGLLDRTGFVPR